MKLIVVGTGRSGTGYMAALLNACGVRSGHEDVFKPAVVLGRQLPEWGDWEADASWMAVPMLGWLRTARAHHVVLITRHPADAVRSLLGLGIFDRWDDYQAVIREVTPLTMAQPTAPDRALAHWVAWNTAASLCADEVIQLEQLAPGHLVPWLQAMGKDAAAVEPAFDAVPRNVNDKAGAKTDVALERDMFRAPILRTAEHVAASFGYEPGWL